MIKATEELNAVGDREDDSDGVCAEVNTESIVEAVLFATVSPISPAKIAQVIGQGTVSDVKKHIATLNERYESGGSAFRIEEIAGGFQMLTLPEYNVWLSKLFKSRRDTKLSQAALETLAVVAYEQPVMRARVEEVRGVAVGDVLLRLREMNLIKIVGRAEEIGRPLLYGTTKRFLEVFGFSSLDELPKVEALTPPEKQSKATFAPEAQDEGPTLSFNSSDEPTEEADESES